jgi:hypothetical protein
MKTLYYTNEADALHMTENFGVVFQPQGEDETRWVVEPSNHPIFEPHNGDEGVEAGHGCYYENDMWLNTKTRRPLNAIRAGGVRIIARHNIYFINPAVEEKK